MSCVEAVNSIIDGLRPVQRNYTNRSDGDHDNDDSDDDDGKMDIANATSSIVEALQDQITLTLRRDGAVRIIEPNIACEGVIIGGPSGGDGGEADEGNDDGPIGGGGIGIVIMRDDGVGLDDMPTMPTPTTVPTDGPATTTMGNENMSTTSTPVSGTATAQNTTVTDSPDTKWSTTPSSTDVIRGQPPTLEFTNDTVVVINDINDVIEDDTVGLVFVPKDFFGPPINNSRCYPDAKVLAGKNKM